ncbi:hypothetical protein B0E55_05268 [Rhodococcus sp. 66b]|nr:hypothetical protein B0E55_05268 [Rhodococcus sp. 66b]
MPAVLAVANKKPAGTGPTHTTTTVNNFLAASRSGVQALDGGVNLFG